MKLNLVAVAIVLSLVSIALSLAQPMYNFLISRNQETTIPHFSLYSFAVGETYTTVHVQNDGNATAHDVLILLSFENRYGEPQWATSEIIPEIEPNHVSFNYLSIGSYQLKSAISSVFWTLYNSMQYEVTVEVYCKEIPYSAYSSFSYNVTIAK
jgi:hypothetical protein